MFSKRILTAAIPVDRGAEIEVRQSPAGSGVTSIAPRKGVVSIAVPFGGSFLDRFVRVHELLHAKYSKYQKNIGQAEQAVEDSLNHGYRWPRDNYRILRHAALVSLRRIARMSDPEWNEMPEDARIQCGVNLIGFLPVMYRAADKLDLVRRAEKRLGLPEGVCDGTLLIYGHELRASAQRKALVVEAQTILDLIEKPNDWQETKTSEKLDMSADGGDATMEIVEPERPLRCDKGLSMDSETSRQGMRLNVRRAVAEIVAPLGRRIFDREVTRPGFAGTILIDASGSMCWTETQLSELCQHAPGALVAYYSGSAGKGFLVIAAKNGRRIARVVSKCRSNEVDLPALQWLHRQKGPRVYVGDGGFCGKNMTALRFAACTSLADRADLWLPNVEQALEWAKRPTL